MNVKRSYILIAAIIIIGLIILCTNIFFNEVRTTLKYALYVVLICILLPSIAMVIFNDKLKNKIGFAPISWKGIAMIVVITIGIRYLYFSADYFFTIFLMADKNSLISMLRGVYTVTSNNIVFDLIEMGIVAPITEEFIFRGFLMSYLRRFGDYIALIATSILFALIHPGIFMASFIISCFLGYSVISSKSIYSGIIAHITFNCLALAEGQFDMFNKLADIFMNINSSLLQVILFFVMGGLSYLLFILLKRYRLYNTNTGLINQVVPSNHL